MEGRGFKSSCGGFAEIVIGGQDFPAAIVAQRVLAHDDLVAALRVLAEIPLEEFSLENKPSRPLMGWNDHQLRVEHVLAARKALAKAGAA